MAIVLNNRARGTLAAAVSASDYTITLQTGEGDLFPTLGVSDHFYATLLAPSGAYEIVRVTSRVGDSLIAVRAAEGTSALNFPAGSVVEQRITAASIVDAATDAADTSTTALLTTVTSDVYSAISDDIAADTVSKEYTATTSAGVLTYDLGEDPGAADKLLVFLDGAYQETADWSLVGTSIVLGADPGAGAELRVVSLAVSVRNSHVLRRQAGFPGDTPEAFSSSLTGRTEAAVSAPGSEVFGTYGYVRRLIGLNTLSTAERAHLRSETAAFLEVTWEFYRHADVATGTPQVQLGLYYLDADFDVIGGGDVVVETNTATVASGLQRTTKLISKTVDAAYLNPPATAVYVVPYIKTLNATGSVDVIRLDWAHSAEFATVSGSTNYVDARDVDVEGFQWPPSSIPEFPVARTFYVTMDGSDSNSGTSLSKPLATINAAIAKMAALGTPTPVSCVTIVQPGEYVVQPDTVIPQNCALYGYDLRVTKLSLPIGQEQNNMFQLTSGVKVRGFTFSGLQHETIGFDPLETDADNLTVPTKGWAFVFKDGEIITRSPYIADCSQLHALSQDQMALPIDRDNGNPDMPLGGGNLLADGAALDPDSPLRSVVVDSFTAINPNGIGYAITRNAFVQLVSVFTNWSRVGLWCHQGGQVTVANSNSTFGDYALAATGFRNAIQLEGVPNPANITEQDASAGIIDSQFESIVADLMVRYDTLPGWSASYNELADRDTRTILRALANDLRSGQDRATQYVIKGFFNWNAEFAFDPALVGIFVASWDEIEAELLERFSVSAAETMVTELITFMQAVVNDVAANDSSSQYVTAFPSVIEATGQQFSYAGSGVNYNSLPFSQRGTGEAPDPSSAIVKIDGGRVYATFSTEVGDTYLGEDLRVDFERSTIEGQAFSRGVQNIALPLIVALGG
jgi:hypothetical protein